MHDLWWVANTLGKSYGSYESWPVNWYKSWVLDILGWQRKLVYRTCHVGLEQVQKHCHSHVPGNHHQLHPCAFAFPIEPSLAGQTPPFWTANIQKSFREPYCRPSTRTRGHVIYHAIVHLQASIILLFHISNSRGWLHKTGVYTQLLHRSLTLRQV